MGFFSSLRQLWSEAQADDITGLAAELAYRFLFALFPLFIFLAALGGFIANWLPVDDPTAEIMDRIGDTLPEDAASLVESQLTNVIDSQSAGLLSFGILLALWAASGGMKATMKAMNRAYDVEESRPFLRKNAVALGLTVLIGLAVIVGFTVITTGQVFATQIAEDLGVGDAFAWVLRIAQWPVAALVLLFGIAFLYWAAPNAGLPFRWISAGAVLFVVVWLVMTFAFSLYVANFGSYSNTYGALGGVIVLLLWFYLTGIVLLLGAELNAILARRAGQGEAAAQGAEGARVAGGRGMVPAAPLRPVRLEAPADGRGREEAPRPSRVNTVLGAWVAGTAVRRAAGREQEADGGVGRRDGSEVGSDAGGGRVGQTSGNGQA